MILPKQNASDLLTKRRHSMIESERLFLHSVMQTKSICHKQQAILRKFNVTWKFNGQKKNDMKRNNNRSDCPCGIQMYN